MPTPQARNFMIAITAEHTTGIDDLEQKTKTLGENLDHYAIITHDLDAGGDHYHVAIKTKNPTRLSTIANALDQPENLVQIWRRNEGNLWAYLTHQTKTAKAHKVDYTPYLDNPNKARFDSTATKDKCKYDRTKTQLAEQYKIEQICENIILGNTLLKDLLKPDLVMTYWRHKNKIDKALQLRTQTLRYNAPQCKTTLITGNSGTGKTKYAIDQAKTKYPDHWLMASAGNDPLQDYNGEKCIIFDDWRPQDYPLQDLLALLDPNYRQRTHKSRYYNKPLATELILITTNNTLDAIIDYYTGFNHEDPKQIRRRINTIVTMHDDYTPTIEVYDELYDGWVAHEPATP